MVVTVDTTWPDTDTLLIPAAYGEPMLLANVKLKLNLMLMLTTTAVLDIPALDIPDILVLPMAVSMVVTVDTTWPDTDTLLIPAAYGEPMLLANVKLKLNLRLMLMLSSTADLDLAVLDTMVVTAMVVTPMPAHTLVSIMGMALVIWSASRFLTVRSLKLLARNCHRILYKASSIPILLWLARGVFCHCTNVTNIYLFVLS